MTSEPLTQFLKGFENLPHRVKQSVLLVADLLSLLLCLWGSFALESGEWFPPIFLQGWWIPLFTILVYLPIFVRAGMYRTVIRYSGAAFFITIFKSVVLSGVVTMVPVLLMDPLARKPLPWVANIFFLLLITGGIRWAVRCSILKSKSKFNERLPIIIYGAGSAGAQLVMALEHSIELQPIAFVDDDKAKQGRELRGITIYPPSDLKTLIDNRHIRRILLAIPSLSRSQRHQILQSLESLPVRVLDMPSLAELGSGTKKIDDIQDVSEQDLLGRDPVPPDQTLLHANVAGKSVLVTGAGGSIGSELCRQIIRIGPQRLVLLERSGCKKR